MSINQSSLGGIRLFRFSTPLRIASALFMTLIAAPGLTVQRHGVTWTISGSPQNGVYANGDPWVVGPITITSISPTPSAGRNGTVVNPALGRNQGFDSRISSLIPYSEALNVGNNLPLSVAVNSSVISTVSASGNIDWGQVDSYSILTVPASAPITGSFRPPYIGSGSRASAFTKGDIGYSRLAKLPSQGLGAPQLADLEDRFERLWYEQDLSWTGRYLHTPFMGLRGYGKNMALQTGDAALLLNLDFTDAQKEKLLISIIQYGIDIHGILQNGGKWAADGGHNPGRLSPLIVAAMVLDDAGMKSSINGASLKFQEYQQTFYVTQSDVNQSRYTADGRPRLPYSSSDIGMPEWGITHSASPKKDGNNWNAYYRDIAGSTMTASTMAAQVMGAEDLCNWGPLFGYARRHVDYEQGASYGGEFSSNSTPKFHKNFYNAHKSVNGPGPSTADTTPPSVSNVLSDPASTTATITWSTGEASDSFVDFGPTEAYGSRTGTAILLANHSVSLQELIPDTLYHFRVKSKDAAGNQTTAGDFTFTTAVDGSDPVSMPTIEPEGSVYLGMVTVQMSCDTEGAAIYYTLDGTTPTASSTQYTAPFVLSSTSTVQAIGVRSGMSDSPIRLVEYGVSNTFTSDDQWQNLEVPKQTSNFVFSYDISPHGEGVDSVIGLSMNPANEYTSLAVIVRFSEAGFVEARNGGVYQAVNPLSYQADISYHVEMLVNLDQHTYSASVTPAGGSPVQIALNYAFRSEQSGISSVSNLALISSFGTAQIFNVNSGTVDPGGLVATPTILPNGGEFLEPVMVALNSPTPGSAIRYTTDGSDPTDSSAIYTAEFPLIENSEVRVFATRPGSVSSGIGSASFSIGSALLNSTWKNFSLRSRSDNFVVGTDFVFSKVPQSGVLGFSEASIPGPEGIVAGLRLGSDGKLEALNGSIYGSVDNLICLPGVSYHAVISFDTLRKRYSVFVLSGGGSVAKIALNWAFSSTNGDNLNSIGNIGMNSVGEDITLSDFRVNHPSDVLLFPGRPKPVREKR